MQGHGHAGKGQRGLVDADGVESIGQQDGDAGAAFQAERFERQGKQRDAHACQETWIHSCDPASNAR